MQLKPTFYEYISHKALLIVGVLNFNLNQHTVKNFEDVYCKRTNVITAMVCVWTAKLLRLDKNKNRSARGKLITSITCVIRRKKITKPKSTGLGLAVRHRQ